MESEEQRNRRLGLRGINMPLLCFMSFGSSAAILGAFAWVILSLDPNIGTYPIQKWINLGVVMFIVGPLIGYGIIRHAEEEDHKYDPFGYTFPAMPLILKMIACVWFVLSIAGFVYLKAQT